MKISRASTTKAAASELRVVVPYTTPELTRAALCYVAALGGELEVKVRLIDAYVVPFRVPAEPLCGLEFLDRRLHDAAKQLGLAVRMELLLTRDRVATLRKALEPGSLVVIAARGWWWFSAERRLARSLSNAGHEVVLLSDRQEGGSLVFSAKDF